MRCAGKVRRRLNTDIPAFCCTEQLALSFQLPLQTKKEVIAAQDCRYE